MSDGSLRSFQISCLMIAWNVYCVTGKHRLNDFVEKKYGFASLCVF
jgi:hypothetical protein